MFFGFSSLKTEITENKHESTGNEEKFANLPEITDIAELSESSPKTKSKK